MSISSLSLMLVGVVAAAPAAAAPPGVLGASGATPSLALLPLRATDLPTNEVARLDTLLRARATARGAYEVQAAELTTELVDAAQGLGLDCAVDTLGCGVQLGQIVDVRFVLLGQAAAVPAGGGVGVDLSLVDVGAGTIVRRVRGRLPQAIEARAEGANALADLLFGQAPLGVAEITPGPATADTVVTIDGLVAARGPGPHVIEHLAPGPHVVGVTARRFLPVTTELVITDGRVALPVALLVDPDAEVEVVGDEVKVAAFVTGGVGAAVAAAGGVMLGVGLQPFLEHGRATADLDALDQADPGYPSLARDQFARASDAAAAWELWGGPLTVAGGVALGLGVTAAVAGLGWGTALVLTPPVDDDAP